MEFYKIALRYLQSCNIRISKRYFREKIMTHPDYPSLVSLTDTLNELGLEYSAYRVKKENYLFLEYPLLLHVKEDEKNNFVQVNSGESIVNNELALYKNWDGICFNLISQKISNSDHNLQYRKENRSRKFSLFTLLFIFIIILAMTWNNPTWIYTMVQICSILGLIICYFIVLQSLGIENSISTRFCDSNNVNNCNKVLLSKTFSWKGFNLGDFGAIYFTGMCIYVSIASLLDIKGSLAGIGYITFIPGFLVAILSILYQWLVIKGWCKLCLFVDFILFLQAFMFHFFIADTTSFSISFSQIILLLFCTILPAFIWIEYKKSLLEIEDSTKKHMDGTRFMRDPQVFLAMVRNQNKIDTAILDNEIILGNSKAPIQLLIVANPYCLPCANAHKDVESLLLHHSENIGVTIRFLIKDFESTDLVTSTVKHILSLWLNGNKKAVDAWFAEMELETYLLKYTTQVNSKLIRPLLDHYKSWASENNISFTPSIFINGYEWPKHFNLSILNSMMMQLSENMERLQSVTYDQNSL